MQEHELTPLGNRGQIIEVDETYLGGKKYRKGVQAGRDNKIPILGIAEHNGRVFFKAIPNCKAESIKPILDSMVSHNVKQIVTDAKPTYSRIIPTHLHLETNHREELRELGFISMKTIEGAFSLFKRGLIGSYHKLSQDHLNSYLGEFCWRYNRRKAQPWMFQSLLANVSTRKPMTYRTLTREIF